MNTTLTKYNFERSVGSKNYLFTEYKTEKDIYRVEYLDSFLKCAIQKTDEGVQVIYLDSLYIQPEHMKHILGYVTFVIAYRINGNKGFMEIEFNKDGKIISMQ